MTNDPNSHFALVTNKVARNLLFVGALLGCSAVCLGAFGAHWLSREVARSGMPHDVQARRLENWDVAVRYQMYHALALLAAGLCAARQASRFLAIAAWMFVVGTFLFSGCLYVLVLTDTKRLGAIVPLGGVSLVAGWVMLALAVWQPAAPRVVNARA